MIAGLDPAATDLEGLCKALKVKFATGGSVQKDELCVELQGDQREGVIAYLRELGYPAKAAGG